MALASLMREFVKVRITWFIHQRPIIQCYSLLTSLTCHSPLWWIHFVCLMIWLNDL